MFALNLHVSGMKYKFGPLELESTMIVLFTHYVKDSEVVLTYGTTDDVLHVFHVTNSEHMDFKT
jgi:hypothetical protein